MNLMIPLKIPDVSLLMYHFIFFLVSRKRKTEGQNGRNQIHWCQADKRTYVLPMDIQLTKDGFSLSRQEWQFILTKPMIKPIKLLPVSPGYDNIRSLFVKSEGNFQRHGFHPFHSQCMYF